MKRRIVLGAVALLGALALTGCGGKVVENPDPTPLPQKLAITSSAISTRAGGAALTLTASGGTGKVSWALEPASGAGALSASEGERVTFTPPPAVAGTTTVAVTALSGEQSAFVLLTVEPEGPRRVEGRVLSVSPELPVKDALVALLPASQDQVTITTSTNADGRFTLPDVPDRYDLAVRAPGGNLVRLFKGITRLDPTLSLPVAATRSRSCAVSGVVTGGGFPASPPTGSSTQVFAQLPEMYASATVAPDGSYSFSPSSLRWSGDAAMNVTLHALQLKADTAGNVSAYYGYGKLDGVSIADGSTVTGRDIPLSSPVSTTTLSGTHVLPDGYSVTYTDVYLRLGTVVPRIRRTTTSGTFGSVTPQIDGARIYVVAEAAGPNGALSSSRVAGLPINASNVELSFAPAVRPLQPAADATGIRPGTVFSWSATLDGIYELHLQSAGAGSLHIVTADTEVTIPDLSSIGFALAPSTAHQWYVEATHVPAITSVDDYLGEGAGTLGQRLRNADEPTPFQFTNSGNRAFTTAP